MTKKAKMDAIIALCRRRGFIFNSSEIYGGINGFFDYGPMGSEMRHNIKNAWWRDMVQYKKNIVGLDSSIIMNASIWKHSGHIKNFSDLMIDCKESKLRYRADQIFFSSVIVDNNIIGYISVLYSNNMELEAEEKSLNLKKKLSKKGSLNKISLKPITEATKKEYLLIPSPATNNINSLTFPKKFNLMFETNVGAVKDLSSLTYLRPETAQGIFANFKNILNTTRLQIPFGIAQIGKAFRNEITPRNYIFRSREFEQMEIEYFVEPKKDIYEKSYEDWIKIRLEWIISIGVDSMLLKTEACLSNNLAHYAKLSTDIKFEFPFGEEELEGIAVRGDYDLLKHHENSNEDFHFFDKNINQSYIPYIIESSLGLDRLFLAIMCSAYSEDEINGSKRIFLKLHPRISPIKIGIFPLLKNNVEIVKTSEEIFNQLIKYWNVYYDESGAIGRRYRRMDEIGTPFNVTIDFKTLENNTVTLRYRDTAKQIRIHINELLGFFKENIDI